MHTRNRWTLTLVCGLVLGCGNGEVESHVQTWLRCDECLAGELNAVLAAGGRAVPSLSRALRGLPPARLDSIRTRLQARYDRINASDSLTEPRDAYVARFVQHYINTTQVRAAVALDSIGTGQALDALRKAYEDELGGAQHYTPSVFRRITDIHLGNAPAGAVPIANPDTGGFADTIVLRPGAGISWTGRETFTLHDQPMWTVMQSSDSAQLLVPSTFVGPNALIVKNNISPKVQGSASFDVRSVFVNPARGTRLPAKRFFISLSPDAPNATYRVCGPGSHRVRLGWQTRSNLDILVSRTNGQMTDSARTNDNPEIVAFQIPAVVPADCRDVAFMLVSTNTTMAEVIVTTQ